MARCLETNARHITEKASGMMPVLYSFRRCPYAMRARLALASAGVEVALREIVLRAKPAAFLDTSPSGTVPCLKVADTIIDESLDVMIWALGRQDPECWRNMPVSGWDWIERADGPFKHALDRTKYATRYPDQNAGEHRVAASVFLTDLDAQIGDWILIAPHWPTMQFCPLSASSHSSTKLGLTRSRGPICNAG